VKGVVEIDPRFTWKRGLPTEPGWYWFRNTKHYADFNPRMVELTLCGGEIALKGCRLKGFDRYTDGEWQPVQGPVE